jgi:hypothetical protein
MNAALELEKGRFDERRQLRVWYDALITMRWRCARKLGVALSRLCEWLLEIVIAADILEVWECSE